MKMSFCLAKNISKKVMINLIALKILGKATLCSENSTEKNQLTIINLLSKKILQFIMRIKQ
jgi:hypothetical protein